jgi:hypothetical protein
VVCSWLGNSPRIAQQSYLLDRRRFREGRWRAEGDGEGVISKKSASVFEQPGLERYRFALSRAILD